MHSDLREALVPVQWAEAQLPIMERRLAAWNDRNPYGFVVEPDLTSADMELVTVELQHPLDPLIIGDVGAIINSIRTSLDLLMSAIVARHSPSGHRDAKFPIMSTGTANDFLSRVRGLEIKHSLSAAEVAAIERTKAYPGGDHVLSHIAILDNMRKHERLLRVEPELTEINFGFGALLVYFGKDSKATFQARRGRMASVTKANTNVTAQIFLNEAPAGVGDKPAMLALTVYKDRVKALIENFP